MRTDALKHSSESRRVAGRTKDVGSDRYLSSVQVPEREQDQAYVATESWITFDEQGVRTELAQAFGASNLLSVGALASFRVFDRPPLCDQQPRLRCG